MLRLVWIPKEYKDFSFEEITKEAKSILRECKERNENCIRLYADLMILQNKVANLTEEEARHNLEILIPWIESQFPEIKEIF